MLEGRTRIYMHVVTMINSLKTLRVDMLLHVLHSNYIEETPFSLSAVHQLITSTVSPLDFSSAAGTGIDIIFCRRV